MRRVVVARWTRAWTLLGTAFGFVACASQETPLPQENVGHASSAVFVNGDFEQGAAGQAPQSWTVATYLNSNGLASTNPQSIAAMNLSTGGKSLTTTINGTNQTDPDLGVAASLRWPRYGSQAARVNFHSSTDFTSGGSDNGKNVNALSQTMTLANGDIDPVDNKIHVRFTIAPVLQNPKHVAEQQPYYFVQLTNLTKNKVLYTDFNLSAQPGVPWKTIHGGTSNEIDYIDWSLVDISSSNADLAVGDQVQLVILAAGCSLGGHFGEVYVDGVGTTIPGLFVSGTAPAQVNPGSNITYDMTYKNGSANPETGVTFTFTTPPGTTFQSITPPPGVTCTTPAVGAAGTISCTIGNVAAGGSGSFSIVLGTNGATPHLVTAGTYDIKSNQETPLLGSKIDTIVGCAGDTDCTTGNWCNISANTCSPKIANGNAMPTDAAHTAPKLTGICATDAATLVCTSAVCDVADNKCGYANGDGACSAANGGVVCRSTVCDADGKCGYTNGNGSCTAGNAANNCRSQACGSDGKCGLVDGNGPCSAANAATVCRSGACSVNGTCRPSNGCNDDADCTAGNWCNVSAHTCTAKSPNGTSLPSDPSHQSPTLNGTCSLAAGALVCASGVCDGDDKCGFGNGNGSCTTASAGTVCRSAKCDSDGKCGFADGHGPCTVATEVNDCRSGSCSTSGVCQPAGACTVDADCAAGKWCSGSTHTCTPKLANGTAIPNEPAHPGTTLDGTCSTAAASLVCASGVCDADNKCGFGNGNGSCTTANASTVCRSGKCDPDGKCGLADGHGPCTPATGTDDCRSGSCSTSGICQPSGGCTVDADCGDGKWCNITAHACTSKLANGESMPTDTSHTSPSLDGTCSPSAASLVCASGVCDADNKCGLGNGEGPCTSDNGKSVCRSTICATEGANAGLCEACAKDGDCPTGQICNADNVCAPPSDAGNPPPAEDAGTTTGADASTADNADGSVAGGGIACSVNGARGSNVSSGVVGALSVLGVLATRRRRRDRSNAS